MSTRRSPLVLALSALSAASCAQVLDIDKDYVQGGGGAISTAAGIGGGGGGAGAGTAGSSGGRAGSAGVGGSGGVAPVDCSATLGPAMIDVGGYCVDATEVTNAQYRSWLASGPSVAGQPTVCTFNTAYWDTTTHGALPADNALPVTYVDWCDAFAFCIAAGKHLCGKIGGGGVDATTGWLDPAQSEWMRACSDGIGSVYPYGDSYEPNLCNGVDAMKGSLQVVASMAGCHGTAPPFDGLFDMSGNAYEWEDSCDASTGATDFCHRRGGSDFSDSLQLRCTGDDSVNHPRSYLGGTIGFRCCKY